MAGRGTGFLLALGALTFAFTLNSVAEPAVPAVKAASQSVKSSAKKTVVKRQAVRKKATRKSAARKAKAAAPSLAIVTKPPNDAPDFDFSKRIEDAQALATGAPFLPTDMVIDKASNSLNSFVWTLVVGKRTGPLTIVRMDQKGNNDKGLNITWRIDNFLNTRFQVADGYIVFAPPGAHVAGRQCRLGARRLHRLCARTRHRQNARPWHGVSAAPGAAVLQPPAKP